MLEVVREFFEALVALDYDKAGVIYEAILGNEVKVGFGVAKYLRVIEVGKPAPHPLTRGLRVPVKVEVEINGRRQVQDFSPIVRPAAGQPERWVTCGGF
jgi:hypothetical protein